MNTPEQHILDDWKLICDDAKYALENGCCLTEDETIVAMDKYITELRQRVDALEEFVGIISKGIPNIPNINKTYSQLATELLEDEPVKTEKLFIAVDTSRYETLGK